MYSNKAILALWSGPEKAALISANANVAHVKTARNILLPTVSRMNTARV
ncbi:MAG: hypothetical protein ACJA2D_001304 [Pseudohongiellaceae bacterium]|jgi:hypothetical protein